MKPVFQTKFGNPEGNCMAACFASLTGLPIEAFEYEVDEDNWLIQLSELLAPLGYTYVEFDAVQNFGWCGECYMMGLGDSPRGLKHAVIIKHKIGRRGFHNYEWAHDPHPDGGWVKLEAVGLLLPTWKEKYDEDREDDFHQMIGKRIRKARKKMGWTQEVLTRLMGVTNRQTIQQMETGERKLAAEELMKLIELTGCDLDYFTDPYQAIADDVQIHITMKNREQETTDA